MICSNVPFDSDVPIAIPRLLKSVRHLRMFDPPSRSASVQLPHGHTVHLCATYSSQSVLSSGLRLNAYSRPSTSGHQHCFVLRFVHYYYYCDYLIRGRIVRGPEATPANRLAVNSCHVHTRPQRLWLKNRKNIKMPPLHFIHMCHHHNHRGGGDGVRLCRAMFADEKRNIRIVCRLTIGSPHHTACMYIYICTSH